jgi:hypothetical protein
VSHRRDKQIFTRKEHVMFTIFLVAINIAVLALGLVDDKEAKPKSGKDDHSGPDYPCV